MIFVKEKSFSNTVFVVVLFCFSIKPVLAWLTQCLCSDCPSNAQYAFQRSLFSTGVTSSSTGFLGFSFSSTLVSNFLPICILGGECDGSWKAVLASCVRDQSWVQVSWLWHDLTLCAASMLGLNQSVWRSPLPHPLPIHTHSISLSLWSTNKMKIDN